MIKKTTIQITNDVKEQLDILKIHPREPYTEVLSRILDKIDLDKNWKAFTDMTVEMQSNIIREMFEADNNYMFSINSDAGYAGLQDAYYTDKSVRNCMNNAIKKLGYI